MNRRRSGRYPPLLAIGLIFLIALGLLPSALRVPRTDPGVTLEYAPVPQSGEESAPRGGALASLGLGSTATVGLAPTAASAGAAPAVPGAGDNPASKLCVGDPPRQTADPLSPPCVAHFAGDNGGASAHGVTRDEVRILVYFDRRTNQQVTSRGVESCGCVDQYHDLAEPPKSDEYVFNRMLRAYQRYFNERFQTYNRFVHIFVHYGRQQRTPEARRADASEAIAKIKPYAVVTYAEDNADSYVTAVASKGVPVFIGYSVSVAVGEPADSFLRHPARIWSYLPTLEQRAEVFSTYVCRKVVGHKVSFSADAAMRGRARTLGLLRVTDQTRPDLVALGRLVQQQVEACGGRFAAVRDAFANCQGEGLCEDPRNPAANVAEFQQRGVTTVVWAGGIDVAQTRSAAQANWRPEWVVLGDGRSDTTANGRQHVQEVWRGARTVTQFVTSPRFDDRHCVVAAREADPQAGRTDLGSYGCEYYPSLLQVFTGIQVAGPKLSVASMDKGFHAIPDVPSAHPSTPACFYDEADYACVKDGAAAWWDADRPNENGTVGCWRMMEGGRRYLAGAWPAGDVDVQRSGADACNHMGRDNVGY